MIIHDPKDLSEKIRPVTLKGGRVSLQDSSGCSEKKANSGHSKLHGIALPNLDAFPSLESTVFALL